MPLQLTQPYGGLRSQAGAIGNNLRAAEVDRFGITGQHSKGSTVYPVPVDSTWHTLPVYPQTVTTSISGFLLVAAQCTVNSFGPFGNDLYLEIGVTFNGGAPETVCPAMLQSNLESEFIVEGTFGFAGTATTTYTINLVANCSPVSLSSPGTGATIADPVFVIWPI